eukprot:4787737-Amphidinium_carterae.1
MIAGDRPTLRHDAAKALGSVAERGDEAAKAALFESLKADQNWSVSKISTKEGHQLDGGAGLGGFQNAVVVLFCLKQSSHGLQTSLAPCTLQKFTSEQRAKSSDKASLLSRGAETCWDHSSGGHFLYQ